MSEEWLYVIELAPSGFVKVGRTAKIGARLSQHIANARFGGGAVARVFTTACNNAALCERVLIDTLARKRGVVLVHGKETFAGVTFSDAVEMANKAADVGGARPLVDPPRPTEGQRRTLLAHCGEVMDGLQVRRLALSLLRDTLAERRPEEYAGISVADLGKAVRTSGLAPSTVWCQASGGRAAYGIKREWIVAALSVAA